MTFEGFDAAPLIESGRFSVELASMAEPDAATLDAALREAARAERAATRAEALLLDLWVRPGSGFEILDLPARGATSAQAWAVPSGDNDQAAPDGGKDFGLRAAYGDKPPEPKPDPKEEEILVKGSKTNTMNDGSAWVDFWGGSYEGDGEIGGGPAEPGEEQQNDCRDRKALDAKQEIRAEGDRDTHEHGVIVYRGADGQVHRSRLIQGTPEQVDPADVFQWLSDNGISVSQVIGFVHNHPAWQYARSDSEAAINRYPSANDWGFAQSLVAAGAGGPNGENFALYLVDTAGKLREFEYDDRATYQGLSQTQKEGDVGLPPEMESDGSSC